MTSQYLVQVNYFSIKYKWYIYTAVPHPPKSVACECVQRGVGVEGEVGTALPNPMEFCIIMLMIHVRVDLYYTCL